MATPKEEALASYRSFTTEQQGQLQKAIAEKIRSLIGVHGDIAVLVEYISVMLQSDKHHDLIEQELEAFLQEQSRPFVTWLGQQMSVLSGKGDANGREETATEAASSEPERRRSRSRRGREPERRKGLAGNLLMRAVRDAQRSIAAADERPEARERAAKLVPRRGSSRSSSQSPPAKERRLEERRPGFRPPPPRPKRPPARPPRPAEAGSSSSDREEQHPKKKKRKKERRTREKPQKREGDARAPGTWREADDASRWHFQATGPPPSRLFPQYAPNALRPEAGMHLRAWHLRGSASSCMPHQAPLATQVHSPPLSAANGSVLRPRDRESAPPRPRNFVPQKWRVIRANTVVRQTEHLDSPEVRLLRDGEIVESVGPPFNLPNGIVRVEITHPSSAAYPNPIGWVTQDATAAGGARFLEPGPQPLQASARPARPASGGWRPRPQSYARPYRPQRSSGGFTNITWRPTSA